MNDPRAVYDDQLPELIDYVGRGIRSVADETFVDRDGAFPVQRTSF